MLKMTVIKLELIVDVNVFQFIEKGMHGGVSYIANRYGKANNKYMKEYDEKVPSNVSCIRMLITFMDGLCLNIYLLVVIFTYRKRNKQNGLG